MASNRCEHGTPIGTGCDAGSDAGVDRSDASAHGCECVGESAFWFCGRGRRLHFSLGAVHWTDLLPYLRARRLSSDDAKVVGAHAAPVWLPPALAGFCVLGRGAHCLPWRSARASQPPGFLFYRRGQASGDGSVSADLPAAFARFPADVHHFSDAHVDCNSPVQEDWMETDLVDIFLFLGAGSVGFAQR